MATKLEAHPFIRGLGMKRIEKKPFNLYTSGAIFLIISGIGKANAAMAASYLIWRHGITLMINAGAAGAADSSMKIGEIFHITKALESDRPGILSGSPRILKPDVMKGFATAFLSTSDRPVIKPEDRKNHSAHAELLDMEGASIIQACRLSGSKCYLFKIVTDTPDSGGSVDIVKNIFKLRKSLFNFVKENVLKENNL
jgi:adenosylhomocysteine nucleosidase